MKGSGFGIERDSGNLLRMILAAAVIDDFVSRALQEDLGEVGDITSQFCLTAVPRGSAKIISREAGVIAGLPFAIRAFEARDASADISLGCEEGDRIEAGQQVMTVEADAKALLAAERTALNFLQRLSGVASMTRSFVDAVAGTGSMILETRKTLPTLRALDKYAVRIGGGQNHRMGLYDQVLIKENHIALAAPAGYAETVARAVKESKLPVIAEARDLEEGQLAVKSGAQIVMLDNMQP
ncbi:MAG: carboxylating nicotinate-nucleotide diphosphorylase, partial [Planctomycetota bacterium]